MTSNIGVRQLKEFGDGVGFATQARTASSDENSKGVIERALKRTFSPEFLNRLDDVIIFNSLNEDDIDKIIDVIMEDVLKRMRILGYELTLEREARNFLAVKGYDQQFGARPLHRAIQKYLEDPLAEEILNKNVKEGDSIVVKLKEDNEGLMFEVLPEVNAEDSSKKED